VIGIFSATSQRFSVQEAQDWTTLANNVAVAVKNAELYEAQQQYALRLEVQVAARAAELQAALERAQAADRLKSQFISNMNHELRTPWSSARKNWSRTGP
jgi:two-component system sensor histidine kinase/response regulator